MVQEETKFTGPDLTQGIALDELPDGRMLVGHAGDEQILLVRRGSEVFAVGAQCTHYQGPLAEGLLIGDTVRCPWHHACFDLRTGEALRAPALSPIACWNVEQRDGKIAVREKREQPIPKTRSKTAVSHPEKIVIIGGGAAGFAAAEMLRRSGYQNSIVMLSTDNALPYDRPNLSKDYLAGTIPFEYVPLRDDRFYADNNIDTRMGQPYRSIFVLVKSSSPAVESFRTTGCYWRQEPSRSVSPSPAPISRMCARCARSLTARPSLSAPRRHAR
jgi:nitrite reductase/ring-hydroxylating ferredoxin subunit